jgi:hypothetical protein
MAGWSHEAIATRVDHLARDYEGDAFVAVVEQFARELDRRERKILYDVLMQRANMRGMIKKAAHERRHSGWTRRFVEGRLGRRPPGSAK